MRDFSEPASYSFQDFPKTFNAYNPPYDETYRTRDSEANSSSFFHWKTNAGIQQNGWAHLGAYPLVSSERAIGDLSSFSTDVCNNQLTDDAVNDQITAMSQISYQQMDPNNTLGLFRSFEATPSVDPVVRVKEEPDHSIATNIQSTTGNAFLSFPSFQEGINQQVEQSDSNQEFFMQLMGKNAGVEATPMPQPVTTNLEQIIDECMSLDNQMHDDVPEMGNFDTDFANWALGIYDSSPYPQEVRNCRWLDCTFTCKNQEELVSLDNLRF